MAIGLIELTDNNFINLKDAISYKKTETEIIIIFPFLVKTENICNINRSNSITHGIVYSGTNSNNVPTGETGTETRNSYSHHVPYTMKFIGADMDLIVEALHEEALHDQHVRNYWKEERNHGR